MTYDERQEIEGWLDIVRKSCENTLMAVNLATERLELAHCEDVNAASASDISSLSQTTKNKFLKQF